MARDVTVKLKSAGVQEILRTPEVFDLEGRAQRIAVAAGEGMEAFVQVGKARARAAVVTTTREAMEAEATDRALSRALDAGRG